MDIVNPDAAVVLTLGTAVQSATVYRPGTGSTAAQTAANPHRIAFAVPDEVIVVRLRPAPLKAHQGGLPSAPRDLRTETSGSTARLQWSSGSGAVPRAYSVYRMGAFVGQTRTPEFRDSSLMPGAGYLYEVRAIDSVERVSPSANCIAMTKSAFPDIVVTSLTLTPQDPKPGDSVTFAATVKNIGNAPTPAQVVHGVAFLVDDVTVNWCDTFRGPLAPGESRTLTANNGPKSAASWTWTAGPHKVRALFDDVNRLACGNMLLN